uniref:Uncharacterized protein n=1 Tax=Oryza nivara TaxID=4536 RepID=A0A0E0ID53_ORYNI
MFHALLLQLYKCKKQTKSRNNHIYTKPVRRAALDLPPVPRCAPTLPRVASSSLPRLPWHHPPFGACDASAETGELEEAEILDEEESGNPSRRRGGEEKGLPFSPDEESRGGVARSCAREKRRRITREEIFPTSGCRGPFPGVSPRIGPKNPCLMGFQMDMK